MEATTVYPIDDNQSFRHSISLALEAEGLSVLDYRNANEFLTAISAQSSFATKTCIVSDLRMPECSGIELMEQLWQLRIKYPIIMMSGHADIPLAVEAMRRGATHFLEKPFNYEKLLEAIEQSVTGPMNGLRNPSLSYQLLSKLSPREKQVLDLVCKGKLNKTIADLLGISIKTVELHRANMSQKLGVKNIQDLIKLTLGYA